MAGDDDAPSWRSSVGFADRLAVVDKIAMSLEKAEPGLKRPDAMQRAQAEETHLMDTALSLASYNRSCAQRIEFLQSLISTASLSEPDDIAPCLLDAASTSSIGPYTTCIPFASGLFSTLYRTLSPTPSAYSPKLLALKVTSISVQQPPHDIKREARLLQAAAGHPNIVPLLDSFLLPSSTFVLVLPLLPHSLASLLTTSRPTRKRIAEILHDLFSALSHLHSLGIIHRDIKPSNLLLPSPHGRSVLADLGVSWLSSDPHSEPSEHKITDIGTTHYRAPELLFGHTAYDKGVDLWAAGCVVYECLHPQNEALLDAGDLGSELRLIASIFQTLGTPDDETWPEARGFRDWGKIEFVRYPGKSWEEVMPWAEEDGRGLVGSLVKFESGERMSADEVLRHSYFYVKEEG